MGFQKEDLDMILVPSGLIIMFGYHIFLLYRVLTLPHTTVIGYENHNKRAWVERMMKRCNGEANDLHKFNKLNQLISGDSKDTAIALQVISSNVSAATYLASLSITLSSIIGTWVGGSSSKVFVDSVIYGDTSASTSSVKFITLLSFFLVAFTSFIQSARYFLHANFLISTPDTDIPVSYIERAVIRGGGFWSVGLRALYFATALVLWIFGPIPMFACSLSIVVALFFLDSNSTPLHKYGSSEIKKSRQWSTTPVTEPMYTPYLNMS